MTTETEEKIVLRGSGNQRTTLMRCPVCRRQVEMVTPEQAAQIDGVGVHTIHSWVEAGTVHFLEEQGNLWVCVAALSRRGKK